MYILVPSWCKVSSNAVKSGEKMMRSNAESLMAGAGAVYLYFDNKSMRNIIQSLIGSGVAVMKRMRSPLSSVHWTSRAATLIRGKFPMELRTYTKNLHLYRLLSPDAL